MKEHIRDLAPEIALGAISGSERAQALAHLAVCTDCRLFVEELAHVADALLLLAPEAEPPVGFESRMLAQMQPRRRARGWIAVVVAAAILASFATWAGTRIASRPDRLTREYIQALRVLDGASLRAARIVRADTALVGKALLYEGRPSWVFVAVYDVSGDGPFQVSAELTDGRTVQIGSFRVADGRGSWGGTITLNVDAIRALHLTHSVSHARYDARFRPAE